MAELNNQPWAMFAENIARELIEHGATEAAIVTRNIDEDRVVTNYFNCDFEKRCVLIGHLVTDLILEVIETNSDIVREILKCEDG